MISPLERLREVPPAPGRAALSWLGQSGFVIRGHAATVLVDPFLSPYEGRRYESSLRGEDCSGIDLVVCTHEHLDHFDAALAPVIARVSPQAVFVVPTPIVDMVTEVGIAPGRVVGLQPGELLEVADLQLRAVPARHGVTIDDAYDFGESLSGGLVRYLGYVLEVDGVRIYHAGDTIHFEGMETTVRELQPDAALLPINGRDAEREARGVLGNLSEREAAWVADGIGSGVLVPMHHDLFEGNRGWPAAVVEWVEREQRDVTVVVPRRETPFVLTRSRP
jgi:L-ascorbate 6-phosphate lactonase